MLASARDSEIIRAPKNAYPKYCLKMRPDRQDMGASGSHVWQILNANRAPESARFTKNFLVVAPGLIVYDRLLDAFMGKERTANVTSPPPTSPPPGPVHSRRLPRRGVPVRPGCRLPEGGYRRKGTAGGIIAISNWHVLSEDGEEENEGEIEAPGQAVDPKAVVQSILPHTPGDQPG